MSHLNAALTDNDTPTKVKLSNRVLGTFGMWRVARRNLIETVPQIALQEPILSGHAGYPYHMIMDPSALKHVLSDNVENYIKPPFTRKLLRPALGNSLLLAEGKDWRWQRRAAAPIFTPRNVSALGPLMSRVAQKTLDHIENRRHSAVNIDHEMIRATCDIITDVTLSTPDYSSPEIIHQSINQYLNTAGKLTIPDVLGLPSWLSGWSALQGHRALAELRKATIKAIAAREEHGARDVPDLLDHLITAEDPQSHRKMDHKLLMDNILTFIVAGHETTALALTWALYLCAFDQNVQDKARQEAQAVLDGRVATVEDVTRLPYSRMILDEALRLYPPAAIISREAVAEDTLVDRRVEPGRNIVIPIYALHRHRLLWDKPDHFIPERFADPKSVPRYQYLPFGDGPRICIGMNFSLQEAIIILATVLSRYKFALVPGATPYPEMILTLRPQNGLWLNATPV